MADYIGQQFGHYHLLRQIGEGNFAAVYLGEHRYLEIPGAIKILHVRLSPETQEAFRREARTIAHLQHPHIVRVLDFGFHDQMPYLVMEYTPNGTLRTVHPKGTRLPTELAVSYVKQIASALDYAHGERVIHRDIKPENLLLNARGEVVISDFGIAVVQNTLASVSEQNMAGTPIYMAPEQIRHHPCPASDQYAVAVMVYEWLCGEPPFHGQLYEVLGHHLHQAPPSLCAKVPQLPAVVEDAVFGALAKDPAQRFSTVQDFASVLEEACFATQPHAVLPAIGVLSKASPKMQAPPPPQAARLTAPPVIQREAVPKRVRPVSVMCIYATPDRPYLEQWEGHLRPLEQAGYLSAWSERHIVAGAPRQQQIDAQMQRAELIVLLVSSDFFSSDECIALMERALQRQQKGGVHVVPLLLRPVEWQASRLASLSCLPGNGIPVTAWPNRDAAFDACARGICELLGRPMPAALLPPSPAPSSAARRDRKTLLRRVNSFWIDGVLQHSLHGAAVLALGLETQPDAVANPWQLVLQQPDRVPQRLPSGAHISQVYDNANGELLIMGSPGSGKTTLLLELARSLLARAEQDEQHPIPVVFTLSSWAMKRQPLQEWFVDELTSKYQVPHRLGRAWVESDQILPLLDGLDEVDAKERTECIGVINTYRQEHGMLPLVVCSRSADYLAQTARVQLDSAVVVQPLAPQQVMGYLTNAGPQVEALRRALQLDSDLQTLATTPLMLNILILAYQGIPLNQIAPLGTLPDKQQQIFATYVARMLQRSGSNPKRYSAQQTMQWLSWLARQLVQRNQTVYYIEHMQPDWLPSRFLRWFYTALAVRSVEAFIGLFVGILGSFLVTGFVYGVNMLIYALVGLLIGLFTSRGHPVSTQTDTPTKRWLKYVKIGPLLAGLILTPLAGFFIQGVRSFLLIEKSAYLGALIGLVIGILLSLRSSSIQPVEIVSWSWRSLTRVQHLYNGLLVGIAAGLVDWRFFLHNYVLMYALFWVAGGWLISGILGGFSSTRLNDRHRIVPNQGIRNSARNGRQIGLLAGLGSGFIYALATKIIEDSLRIGMYSNRNAIGYGILSALGIGLLSWLFSGGDASIKHKILRCFLWIASVIPWSFSRFLSYATESTLLNRVGGGYIFTHRLLRDYFAALEETRSHQ